MQPGSGRSPARNHEAAQGGQLRGQAFVGFFQSEGGCGQAGGLLWGTGQIATYSQQSGLRLPQWGADP